MVQRKSKRRLFTILVVIGVIALIVAGIAIVRAMSSNTPAESNKTTQKDTPAVTDKAENTNKAPSKDLPADASTEPAIDPEQVSTVTIEPMTITVSYMKGIGGFDYQVLRTPSGTKYVQFSSANLVGTKCTDDIGVFASIIESPTTDEAATLTKTTTTDGMTYGLSLADTTCTSDAGLLKQFQDAFSGAFSLLKKM